MRVGWETEQVSRCRTPRECAEREWEARVWQGNSRENLEGRQGEVVRGKGKELAARWGESVDQRQEAGHPQFWLVCSDAVTAAHRTAGGVAIGSTIGHAISGILFGSSSSYAFVPVEQAAPVQQQACQRGSLCEVQVKDFTQCLEKADLQSCSWHPEQLKAVSQISQAF